MLIVAMTVEKSIKKHPDWPSKKLEIMKMILQEKLRKCPEFAERLQKCKGHELIENTLHEYWGKGASNNGDNMMGKLLTEMANRLETYSGIGGDEATKPVNFNNNVSTLQSWSETTEQLSSRSSEFQDTRTFPYRGRGPRVRGYRSRGPAFSPRGFMYGQQANRWRWPNPGSWYS